jgi:hypothetical protein
MKRRQQSDPAALLSFHFTLAGLPGFGIDPGLPQRRR